MFHYLCRHFNALALAGLMIPAHLEYFCGSRPPATAEIDGDADRSPTRYSSYYDPFYNMDRFFGGVDRAFENPERLLDGPGNAASYIVQPRMDVHEDTKRKTATATLEVPGLRREDLRIDIRDDGWLTISGETKSSSDTNDEKEYALRERRYGEIKAALKDGVLSVTFPKAEESRASSRRLRIL
ncbi:HSP20-like chaperone [Hymenopellis radicata]|nr:HSP20-like chaperone [Hymenopellis radicata]